MALNSGFGVTEKYFDCGPFLNQSSNILLVHLLSLMISLSSCCGVLSDEPMTISPEHRKLVRRISGVSLGGLDRDWVVFVSILDWSMLALLMVNGVFVVKCARVYGVMSVWVHHLLQPHHCLYLTRQRRRTRLNVLRDSAVPGWICG